MPRRGRKSNANRRRPRDYIARDGQWPQGPFEANAPTWVFPLAEFSRRLGAHEAEFERIRRETGIDSAPLARGDRSPNIYEVVSLQEALDVELLPQWPPRGSSEGDAS